MNDDPIVEEARQAGHALFARFNNDMHAVCEYLRQRTEERRRSGRHVASPPTQPTSPSQPSAAAKKVG